MSMHNVSIASVFAVAAAFSAVGEGLPSVSWKPEPKKVLSFGYESLSAKDLIRNAHLIEAAGIDGVGVGFVCADPVTGKQFDISPYVIDAGAEWTKERVAWQLPELKEALSKKGLRESFVMSLRAPRKRIDWEDDAHWARVATNMGIIAWAAKEAGVRGLTIDPEDYHNIRQFDVKPEDKPWDHLAPIVRRRGRQIFEQVFREYPDAAVLSFWLLSWHSQLVYSSNPIGAARSTGDLWPAFVNGILDVMPTTATLIDGNENAYQNRAFDNEYKIAAIMQKNIVFGLVAPENRAKYRQCARAGFGFYMDSYVNEAKTKEGKDNVYYFPPERGSRLGALQHNFAEAVQCSDGYVWLWCEKYATAKYDAQTKLPTGQWSVSRTTWEEKLPGLASVIRATTKPEEFLERDFPKMFKEGRIANMATNDVVRLSNVARFGKTGVKMAGQKGDGYFHIEDPNAQPGSQYVVVLYGHGPGVESRICWQRRKCAWQGPNPWRWRVPPQSVAFKDIGGGKFRGAEVVTVPDGVDCLMLQVSFRQPDKDATIDKAFLGLIPVK